MSQLDPEAWAGKVAQDDRPSLDRINDQSYMKDYVYFPSYWPTQQQINYNEKATSSIYHSYTDYLFYNKIKF